MKGVSHLGAVVSLRLHHRALYYITNSMERTALSEWLSVALQNQYNLLTGILAGVHMYKQKKVFREDAPFPPK